ncbi:MAG TPA: hypothetical protein VF179_20425, partial [Thermoanaerobaculia bacterium]|nr:hypothetical protein [Thermoanaerobaculia bacterium]
TDSAVGLCETGGPGARDYGGFRFHYFLFDEVFEAKERFDFESENICSEEEGRSGRHDEEGPSPVAHENLSWSEHIGAGSFCGNDASILSGNRLLGHALLNLAGSCFIRYHSAWELVSDEV